MSKGESLISIDCRYSVEIVLLYCLQILKHGDWLIAGAGVDEVKTTVPK